MEGLTPCTCLFYRCCALWTRRALKRAKQSARPCGPHLL